MSDDLFYILGFTRDTSFENDVCRDQLRCLWTAYCLHSNMDVDTADYDHDLCFVWSYILASGETDTSDWSDLSTFSSFMCAYLV